MSSKKSRNGGLSIFSSSSKEEPETAPGPVKRRKKKTNIAVRHEGYGYTPHHDDNVKIESLNFINDESDAYRAYKAAEHYHYRGKFWNKAKHDVMIRYFSLFLTGFFQGTVAYWTNFAVKIVSDYKFDTIGGLLEEGKYLTGFLTFYAMQTCLTAWAAMWVTLEPMSGGSGIPEVKIFLNGIDLPRVTSFFTGVAKILGVIGSVAGGLPVGKEGPMVHSGAVIAATVTSGNVRDDKARRDYVCCGAAAGVCTAFSAPIGGILFSLEEGSSYWSQQITYRAYFCSGIAIATLYGWNSFGAEFGKVGLDKLFSFGNFRFDGMETSYAIFELLIFICIGAMGGLIGAVFNNTNERLTHWRIKNVNFSRFRRFCEVICVSSLVSVLAFGLPFIWHKCTPKPDTDGLPGQEKLMVDNLTAFGCPEGYYNEVASLIFADGNDAIKLLFHMHQHTFSIMALFLFFITYISLATLTYGIAVPSGLFVPSLLAGAGFGRLVGNLFYKINPNRYSFCNTYSLIGAASVLGGMARMTISLTIILLEATGNEQFVLPLMLSLFTARIVGNLFNENLYEIHIHLKKGVHFLEAHLRAISGNHNLLAGHIMSTDLVFVRPIESVGVIYDLLCSCQHSTFPVIDTDDRDILFGTVNRHTLCTLLQVKAFGVPQDEAMPLGRSIIQNHVELEPFGTKYVPLVNYKMLEREYPKFPEIKDISISSSERDLYVDLRPYANCAPFTIQETASVTRCYELVRALGLRMLVVVNRFNQCVGAITRDDLVPEALAQKMITKGKYE